MLTQCNLKKHLIKIAGVLELGTFNNLIIDGKDSFRQDILTKIGELPRYSKNAEEGVEFFW